MSHQMHPRRTAKKPGKTTEVAPVIGHRPLTHEEVRQNSSMVLQFEAIAQGCEGQLDPSLCGEGGGCRYQYCPLPGRLLPS